MLKSSASRGKDPRDSDTPHLIFGDGCYFSVPANLVTRAAKDVGVLQNALFAGRMLVAHVRQQPDIALMSVSLGRFTIVAIVGQIAV